MIEWADGVNTKILRNGTSWNDVVGFKEYKTLSGKPKRRIANSFAKRPFTVKMRFSVDEYKLFEEWWNDKCLRGINSFAFPMVDNDVVTYREYQFASNGAPKYSNNKGKFIDCAMVWEEV